jgi:hypothetical protein
MLEMGRKSQYLGCHQGIWVEGNSSGNYAAKCLVNLKEGTTYLILSVMIVPHLPRNFCQVVDLQVFAQPRITLKPLVPSFPCFANIYVSLMEKVCGITFFIIRSICVVVSLIIRSLVEILCF